MRYNSKFDEIRPYCEDNIKNEVKDALARISSDKAFYLIINYLYPDVQKDKITSKLMEINSTLEFQKQFMHPAIRKIIEKSSNGLTYDGFKNISKNNSYLFISNHRDIFLDSGILQILLLENNLPTTQITFGNNLMSTGFVTDLGKVNKMFTVFRGVTNKELYESSKLLSEYIRVTVTDKKESVWIAQGNGRTKDGDDKTQTGLLKMLNVSGKSTLIENFEQLNIIPVSISYEYEPCDSKKTQELYSSLNSTYVKSPDEDLQSIISGITEHKGHIHLSLGKNINYELLEIWKIQNENEKIKTLASAIDNQVYSNYKIWKTNYIAFDLLYNDNLYSEYYTSEEKEQFKAYISKQLYNLDGDRQKLNEIFLNIYANPLKNKLKYGLL